MPTIINPKYILLSEKSQTQETTYYILYLWNSGKSKTRGKERIIGCQGLESNGGIDHKGAACGDFSE